MPPIWQSILIFSTLVYPQPLLAQEAPAPLPSQQWQDNVVLSAQNPVTQTSTFVPIPKPTKRQKLPPVRVECAIYAKQRTGIVTGAPVAKLTLAYASKAGYQTTKTEPVVGGIVQTKEGRVGHVAVIEEVKDGKIRTSERNYPVNSRWIEINDPIVAGYILPKNN